jgi:mxaD protein
MPDLKEVAEAMIDADTLWQEVGDFDSLGRWHPDVSGMTVVDESAGRARLVRFKAGGEQLERLQAIDAAHRSYRYRVERTSLPVRDYCAELRVETADTGMSRVVLQAKFTLTDDNDDRTVETIRSFLHDGAASIEAKYRPYALAEPEGVDRGIADADKKARTGSTEEPVRNTPPAGAWNETSSD